METFAKGLIYIDVGRSMKSQRDSMICYVAAHHDSGRRYVGVTNGTLSARKSNHESHAKRGSHKSRLHDALREYGNGVFSWEVLAEGTERAIRLLERVLIHEWKTNDPAYGFNTDGGHYGQIRHQARKSEAELFMPPLRGLDRDFWERDVEVAILDMMNDLNSIVSYCEKSPLSPERCSDLRQMCHRLLKRVDQLEEDEGSTS